MAGESAIIGAIGIFFLIFIFLWFMFLALAIAAAVFWVFMIVDVAKREFKKSDEKTMWILIVVLTGIIGALIYYFMIKKPNKH